MCWELEADLSVAMRVESAVKRLSRNEKRALITSPENLKQILDKLMLDEVVYHLSI